MTPSSRDLLFIPLGGTGEIGKNLNLYGHDGQWLIVDFGITFGTPYTPGVEIIMPQISFIEEHKDSIVGLVLTHAHEDHLGAIPYLWDQLRFPIFATPFTMSVLRRKLAERGIHGLSLNDVPLSKRFQVGAFDVEFITLTHSIPEPNALVLRTPAGTVVHTGDWKLDHTPLVGAPTDSQALIRAGDEGVRALVCDSTNATLPGSAGSESDVRRHLCELIASLSGRVTVACFSSNIARLGTLLFIAEQTGRVVALVGRSLQRMYESATENGYLSDMPPPIPDRQLRQYPPDQVLLICTGSQGEPRAALRRIADSSHPFLQFSGDDTVIFSSRTIPGNELAIAHVQNKLARLGVHVITSRAHLHTSGHPHQDELRDMYSWVRPEISVPVHGEPRHLRAHGDLAVACQVPHVLIGQNGDCFSLSKNPPGITGRVTVGALGLDGTRLRPLDGLFMQERRKIGREGCLFASVLTGRRQPQITITAPGLLEEGDDALEDLKEVALSVVRGGGAASSIEEACRKALRRAVRRLLGKNSPVFVHHIKSPSRSVK